MNRDNYPNSTSLNSPFSLEELEAQLSYSEDTASGLDDITISAINHVSLGHNYTSKSFAPSMVVKAVS